MTARNVLLSSIVLSSFFIACGDKGGGGDGDASGGRTGDGDASGGRTGDGDGDAAGGNAAGGNAAGGNAAGGNAAGGNAAGGNAAGGNAAGGNAAGGSDASGGEGGESGDGDGEGGEGGENGDGDGDGDVIDPCEETGDFPSFNVQARSDASWALNDFDDVTVTEDDCGIATLAVEWPHETGWESADPGEANSESTKFTIAFPYTSDLTGKQLKLKMRQKENGRGSSATNGGINVVLGAQDRSGYTEYLTPYAEGMENMPGYWGGAYNDGDMINLSLVIADAVPDFDPTDVFQLFLRIDNKFWGDGTDPTFDYEVTELELISLTITDAP